MAKFSGWLIKPAPSQTLLDYAKVAPVEALAGDSQIIRPTRRAPTSKLTTGPKTKTIIGRRNVPAPAPINKAQNTRVSFIDIATSERGASGSG